MTVARGVIVRRAGHGDVDDIAQLAAAVVTQPLLQRYGVSAAGLCRELQRLVDPGRDPVDSLRGAPDSLLLAHAVEPALSAALAGAAPTGELWGLARFSLHGQFGSGGYLRLLALRPGCEGRGIGALLLRAVEEEVRLHSSMLFLLASDFNTGAHRFYTRHGYTAAGTLPDFARPGITENIFWKRLR